jgi:DNA primase
MSTSIHKVRTELDGIKAPNFYQKSLLESISDSVTKKDIQSIRSLHRYFDYNLNFIDRTSYAKPTYVVKVH